MTQAARHAELVKHRCRVLNDIAYKDMASALASMTISFGKLRRAEADDCRDSLTREREMSATMHSNADGAIVHCTSNGSHNCKT